jgi:ABC-type iron transport system FetAB ATPase subunit
VFDAQSSVHCVRVCGAHRVEAVLQQAAATAAVVWVTHDEQQPTRVGGKVLSLPAGEC